MRINCLLFSCLLLLASCYEKDFSLNIVCPTGAPSVAFYNYSDNDNFTTNGKPDNIVAMMTKGSKQDIVVIDTVTGIRAINNGAPYKIAATITFGNFYIASTGNDTDNAMDSSDVIVLFGQSKTPDLIFHYLYGDIYDNAIEYVDNVQDASKCLAMGKNLLTGNLVDYVLLAQPALFSVLNNINALTYGKSSVYANIQEIYKEKTNDLELMQASVFVKNGSNQNLVKNFLTSLENDITLAISNPQLVVEGMSKVSDEELELLYGINKGVAKKVLLDNNSLGLGYKNSYQNKTAIDKYIDLFGLGETNEEVYYV